MILAAVSSQLAPVELVASFLPQDRRVLTQIGMNKRNGVVTEPFIKYIKSESSEFIHSKPIANHVLLIIAYRARRTLNKQNGLIPGQCYMGDHLTIGITRQQYRTAISNLQKWHYITTKATSKGTVVTLATPDVWDININNQPSSQPDNNQQPNQEPTSSQPTDQPLTKIVKKDKKERSKAFVKPSLQELADMFKEKGCSPGEAMKFFNFYESKNWMVGKNKMSKWKSSVALWANRNKDNRQQSTPNISELNL